MGQSIKCYTNGSFCCSYKLSVAPRREGLSLVQGVRESLARGLEEDTGKIYLTSLSFYGTTIKQPSHPKQNTKLFTHFM